MAPIGKSIQINRSGDFWLDVTAFEHLMADCEAHPHRRRATCRACFERLGQAIELYRADFLHEFFLPGCPAFEEWALFKREVLRRHALEALHTLAAWHERLGEWARAEQYARRQLALEPWRELAHQQLMRLLAAGGDRTAALAQYETCRRILSQELAVEPSVETTALRDAIRDGSGPPPLPPAPHNLPAQLSSFVGRERELAEVANRLENPACRLLTLVGIGGVGKSRLAVQAAARGRHTFPDGAWLVELASASTAALVPRSIAAVLGAQEEPGFPLVETLAGALRDKSLALMLDNCEHLLEACAQTAGALLQRCPSLVILATSREPLGLAGEMIYPVQPFSLPDRPAALPVETLMGNEAVRLFAERAAAHFDLTEANVLATAELCKRLDGVPLAIELAAARAGVLALDQMLARLGDRFALLAGGSRAALPRHRTLRALVDWSYDLLSEAERTLFRRLSVFRGGWTLEAAEAVADDPDAALDLLARLADKSLVVAERRTEPRRYSMLETIRDYASEKLVGAGEADAVRDRHFAFFLHLAQSAARNQHGPHEADWFRRLETDHDNLRAAL
ncbi:MAG: AfsR/SARP family transcriptional regulator, partial [Chloroflexi bacterium]|nr:AfsR/SARP family transcriptional regulator [Chloroflexota bacterium]